MDSSHAHWIRWSLLFAVAGMTTVLLGCVSLMPQAATNPVGTQHQVTAVGDPCPASGDTVTFQVSGANNIGPTPVVADSNGATFTYTGSNVGKDTITAVVTTVTGFCADNTDTASKEWTSAVGGVVGQPDPNRPVTNTNPPASSGANPALTTGLVAGAAAFVLAAAGTVAYAARRRRAKQL